MASPRTPAAPDGSTNALGSLADLRKHLSSQGGGSLPTTPAKLAGKYLFIYDNYYNPDTVNGISSTMTICFSPDK